MNNNILNGNVISRNLFFFFIILFFPFFQIFLDQMILLILVVFFGIKYFYGKYINYLHSFLIKNETTWRAHMYYLSFLCTWCSVFFISFYGRRIKALSAITEWSGKAINHFKKQYKFIVERRMKDFGKSLIEMEQYWLTFSRHQVSDLIDKSYLKNNIIFLL
jgi:hypothetical protein